MINPNRKPLTPDSLARYLADRREREKLTQLEAAERAGVSRRTVIRWEKGLHLEGIVPFLRYLEGIGVRVKVSGPGRR